MSGSLGIFVSSERHLEKIINICKAANQKEIQFSIFFTHLGTMLTKIPREPDII
jgi:Ca2+-binding EF-hand superfamily protein